MTDYFACGISLAEAYHEALRKLLRGGEWSECPDYNTQQKECGMTMVVLGPTMEPRISRLIPCGPRELEQYRQEMLDGILDFEIEKGKWAYTYHSRMKEQIPFIIEELKRNPYSRRAVIDIRDWKYDSQTDSPACLQHIQFMIRGGALDMYVLFRSNDAVKATFMNAFALTCLQEKIAQKLRVAVGKYTHRVNSFHCYKQDYALLGSYINRVDSYEYNEEGEIYYNFIGEWEDYMEEFRPEIAEMVEELRARP